MVGLDGHREPTRAVGSPRALKAQYSQVLSRWAIGVRYPLLFFVRLAGWGRFNP